MMTPEDWQRLIELLRYDAALFRLPALPTAWPDWMTQEKRLSMANCFEACADEAEHLGGERTS